LAFHAFGPPDFTVLSPQEQDGRQLFDAVCASCHRTNAHVSDGPSNTGLDAVASGGVNGLGMFKAPSLRNVAVHAPYMHDGRFKTLDDVVAFYDSGINFNANLERRLRGPDGASALRLHLTAAQRSDIVAYLRTLTDTAFLTSERFSNPFVH
jgi:cytochrome c peroxidase